MDTTDLNIIDCVPAHTIEPGDQIIIEGDHIEVKTVEDGSDIDEVIVEGYSHESGDLVMYTLYADDEYNVWSV